MKWGDYQPKTETCGVLSKGLESRYSVEKCDIITHYSVEKCENYCV